MGGKADHKNGSVVRTKSVSMNSVLSKQWFMKEGTDADLHVCAVVCVHAKAVNVKNKKGDKEHDSVVEATVRDWGLAQWWSSRLDDEGLG